MKVSLSALSDMRAATGLLLIGHAWQYFFYPPQGGPGVGFWLAGGGLLLPIGLVIWTSPPRYLSRVAILGLLSVPFLLGQTLASAGRTQWEIAQLMEHTLQWTTPIWLWLMWRNKTDTLPLWMKLAVAFTFTGHGLYALGWPHGRPGHFLAMTQEILGLSDAGARAYLLTAGILDLIVSIGIFFPRLARPLLLYATAWGFVTALARPAAFLEPGDLLHSLNRWLPEMMFRLPHSLVPLTLFLMQKASEPSEAKPSCQV